MKHSREEIDRFAQLLADGIEPEDAVIAAGIAPTPYRAKRHAVHLMNAICRELGPQAR